jgi:hypothetical protein
MWIASPLAAMSGLRLELRDFSEHCDAEGEAQL